MGGFVIDIYKFGLFRIIIFRSNFHFLVGVGLSHINFKIKIKNTQITWNHMSLVFLQPLQEKCRVVKDSEEDRMDGKISNNYQYIWNS